VFQAFCKQCLILGAVGLGTMVVNTAHAEPADDEIILMTGFEPFGEKSLNSSWESVRQFDGLVLQKGRRIVTLQLPVIWETAAGILQQAIDIYNPVLVLSVGQGGELIRLEQNAHNQNGEILDNTGKLPPSEVIIPGGPEVYSTAFNLDTIVAELANAHITVYTSESAGRYLCNFISYQVYHYLAKLKPETRMLFVHVPPIVTLEDAELHQIVTALNAIVRQTSAESPARAVVNR